MDEDEVEEVEGAEDEEEVPEVEEDEEEEDEEEEAEENEGEGEAEGEVEGISAAALADALSVASDGWVHLNPKAPPLTYYVPAHAVGGVTAKTIKFPVDFNNRSEVNKANKTRRLELDRAKKRHGIPIQLKRPSTKGREFTAINKDWISIIHEGWAIENNGQRVPSSILTEYYNTIFDDEGRTTASLLSFIDRVPDLKDMRNSYPV